jgi:protein SCO1/2
MAMARNFWKLFLGTIIVGGLASGLGGCQRKQTWHETDITGSLPPLEFTMTRASDGAAVTGQTYHGSIVALYFGYANCPGPCPLTLSNLTDVLAKLGPDAKKVHVLFVTVDPARDHLDSLKAFIQHFAPEVEGLRGDSDALARLARRYRVAYAAGATGPNGSYIVNHSNAVFIFDDTGRARLITSDTSDTNGLAADFKQLIAEEQRSS